MMPQSRYLDEVRQRALKEEWASLAKGLALAWRMARALLEIAGYEVKVGERITMEKVRDLIGLCGNLKLVPIEEWPREWAIEHGEPRDGLYLATIDRNGQIVGYLVCSPHAQTKRQIWTLLHELVHHVLLCLGMANQVPSLAGQRVIRRRDYLAAVWEGDVEETFANRIVAQMLMDPHLFGSSMENMNLFDLAHTYGVNCEPAAVQVCSLSPVPLVCVMQNLNGKVCVSHRLMVRRADTQLMDIASHLITRTPLTGGCSIHTLRAYGRAYCVSSYVYPVGSGDEQTHRLVAFVTLRRHAERLGIFTAFPTILGVTAA